MYIPKYTILRLEESERRALRGRPGAFGWLGGAGAIGGGRPTSQTGGSPPWAPRANM